MVMVKEEQKLFIQEHIVLAKITVASKDNTMVHLQNNFYLNVFFLLNFTHLWSTESML